MTALDALNRARQAWERTQPQQVIPGVLDDADGREPVRIVEPASSLPVHSQRGGLHPGDAEPRHGPFSADGKRPVVPAHVWGVGVGVTPSTAMGAGAGSSRDTRAHPQQGD